jgi:hypothetical protein
VLYLIAVIGTLLIFTFLYLFEILWLPFAALFSIILFPSQLISQTIQHHREGGDQEQRSYGESTRRYFSFVDLTRPGYANTFWCFPISCFEYFSGASLKDFFLVMYLKIEERSFSNGL